MYVCMWDFYVSIIHHPLATLYPNPDCVCVRECVCESVCVRYEVVQHKLWFTHPRTRTHLSAVVWAKRHTHTHGLLCVCVCVWRRWRVNARKTQRSTCIYAIYVYMFVCVDGIRPVLVFVHCKLYFALFCSEFFKSTLVCHGALMIAFFMPLLCRFSIIQK